MQIRTARSPRQRLIMHITQRSLDNNVDHRKIQTDSDIDSEGGERCLQWGPICPSLRARSLIVDRRDILIAPFRLFFLSLLLREVKYLDVASSIISNPSAVTRYY